MSRLAAVATYMVLASGCGALVTENAKRQLDEQPPPLPYADCPAPPAEPSLPRTVADIAAYARQLELSRRECAERLRVNGRKYEEWRKRYGQDQR